MLVDLKELAVRESERVEWKDNVASIANFVETIVAFANDIHNLGGGYVVCGAKETKDEHGFPKLEITGLTSSRLKEVEGAVLAHCREKVSPEIVPLTEEIDTPNPDRRILVFIVPATGYAHNYRSGGEDSSRYYIRIGRETREARNGLLRELLVRKRALEPWDRRVNQTATIEDIDLLVLRDYLQQMGLWDSNKSLEDYISDKEQLSTFVPPLAGKLGITSRVAPRNFTLLMFGASPATFFFGAFSVFSIYRGKDRSEATAERVDIVGTAVEQAKKLIELLNTETYTAFDKTNEQPNQAKYPRRALQEAIVNAVAHRDYEVDQPIRVTVFVDRIEIVSPGSLPRAVDLEKFKAGKAAAYWRNQALAYFFNKLQLAQAEGQGIPTIIRTMSEEGCPPPIFEIGEESVTCILPAHPRHALMRELNALESKIILGRPEEAASELEKLLNLDPYNFRSLELFCEANNLLRTPFRVFNFLKKAQPDYKLINSGTLILLAETLLSDKENPESVALANEILTQAAGDRLEEQEVKRVAISFRKMKKDEQAVDLIENLFRKSPNLASSATLREIAAKSKIDLAKKCMETARNASPGSQIRARAWDQCRTYLASADKDLNLALGNVSNDVERDFIQRDIEFLRYMQQLAQKPQTAPHQKKASTTKLGATKFVRRRRNGKNSHS
jgi:predicted HTH transcriptional regulator